jgi:transposase
VEVLARLTRWRCRNDQCERRIFAERIPGLAAPFARRTTRLAGIVRLFGHSVGGRPSERLMSRLGMQVAHSTVLREVKRSAQTDTSAALVRVAGVDDWAWKKGMNYGTVIVDLERRRVVDVLPDRSAASTAEWLKRHPAIEVISRDRAGLYAEGAREGAPQARQVADRFHLLQNFREAVERQLTYPGGPVKRSSDGAPKKTDPQKGAHSTTYRQSAQRATRAAQQARFAEIKILYEAGESITAIARALGLGRRRVERWSRFIVLPERNAMAPKLSTPAYFEAFLWRRFTEGTKSVRFLFEEIKQHGYTGSYGHLALFTAPWKNAGRPLDLTVEASLGRASPDCDARSPAPRIDPTTGRQISPLTAAALCVKHRGQMTTRQMSIVDALKAGAEEFTMMRQLAMRFGGLLRGGSLEKLDEWLGDAFSCGIYTMHRFANTLRQDKSAVQNAVTDP